jgi:transposase
MTTKKKSKTSPESIVREIKRKTRRKFTAEEKIRIVLEGLRGEESITDLCLKELLCAPLMAIRSKERCLLWCMCG